MQQVLYLTLSLQVGDIAKHPHLHVCITPYNFGLLISENPHMQEDTATHTQILSPSPKTSDMRENIATDMSSEISHILVNIVINTDIKCPGL